MRLHSMAVLGAMLAMFRAAPRTVHDGDRQGHDNQIWPAQTDSMSLVVRDSHRARLRCAIASVVLCLDSNRVATPIHVNTRRDACSKTVKE